MISADKTGTGEYRFVLSPNCSISWRELVLFYLLTCVVALAVGLFFSFHGLWFVLPFSGLEMMALGVALYLTSRKVHRREVIILNPECTRIEKGLSRIERSWEFSTPWVRIFEEFPEGRRARRRLAIGMSGESVEVGSFLANTEKEALAFQLKDCIIRV